MNLWIRSQNREILMCCNDISIVNYSEFGKKTKVYKIVGYFDKNTEYEELGSYKTKERALEVLDEIQKKINLIFLGHCFKYPMIDLNNPAYSYNMPKE